MGRDAAEGPGARCIHIQCAYSALISACAKGDEAEKTLQPFVEMLRKGLEPKVITYNAFISACAKGDNAVKALQPWVEMLRKGLEPDVITYIAPICACAKGDYAEKTLQLAEE